MGAGVIAEIDFGPCPHMRDDFGSSKRTEPTAIGETPAMGIGVKKPGGESEILTLDPKTLEYRPRQSPKLPSLEAEILIPCDVVSSMFAMSDSATL